MILALILQVASAAPDTVRLAAVDTARLAALGTARPAAVETARLAALGTARPAAVETARLSAIESLHGALVETAHPAIDTLHSAWRVVLVAAAQQDTTRRRRRAIEVSDGYAMRLRIHRTLSYAMLPVFAVQYAAGDRLIAAESRGAEPPSWARPVHQAGAAAVAGIFAVNTVTGVWNLWDSRQVEEHRWLRVTHALTMLSADAAFAYTGLKLADEAEDSQAKRREHRRVALIGIGLGTVSGLTMTFYNR